MSSEFESAMRNEDVSAGTKRVLEDRFSRSYGDIVTDPLATLRARKAAEKAQSAVQNAKRKTASAQHG